MDFVEIATCELANVLTRALSPLDRAWWDSFVVPALSECQRELVHAIENPGFEDLDLASLLAVLDANWTLLNKHSSRTREARNYLKELMTIRIQLCHRTAKPFPAEVMFRHWQTLKLLLELVGGSSHVIRLVNNNLARLMRVYQTEMFEKPIPSLAL
ncbi:MAG: hypothetical protein K9M08_21545 [Pirellula sp.]|nr:hypothetical protein [Pirellula sp.]